MKTAFKILGGCVILLILAAIIMPTYGWSGGRVVQFRILVLDDETESPIQGAEVLFLRAVDQSALDSLDQENRNLVLPSLSGYAVSGQDGIAQFSRLVRAGGSHHIFRTGSAAIEGPITIRAKGYAQATGLIQNFLGKKRVSIWRSSQEMTIYLKQTTEPNQRLQTMRFKLPMNSIAQGPHV